MSALHRCDKCLETITEKEVRVIRYDVKNLTPNPDYDLKSSLYTGSTDVCLGCSINILNAIRVVKVE